jgi:predicted ATPase
VIVLLTYRPGYAPPFGARTYYTHITLHGLPPSQIETMIERFLGVPEMPSEARRLIARRAEGNPLFVEELSRALLDDGTLERVNGGYRLARLANEAAVPDTIQGVIMARIDRLPEVSKTALQVASVIGREFSARLVERVAAIGAAAQQALGELRAVELIYQKSASPELAYLFKHALTHDVAYDSLLRQRRRVLHRRAAEVIEELYAERLPELYETLAWHYVQGETWDKAVHYLLRSADKARHQFALADGARRCEQAIEILDRHGGVDEARLEALERLGDLRSLLGQLSPANEAYDLALGVAPAPEDHRRVANKRHRVAAADRAGATIRASWRWPPQRNWKSRTRWSSVLIMGQDSLWIRSEDQSPGTGTGFWRETGWQGRGGTGGCPTRSSGLEVRHARPRTATRQRGAGILVGHSPNPRRFAKRDR